MAKRKALTQRKNATAAKKKTVKTAPALISEKSKVIKKATAAKRRGRGKAIEKVGKKGAPEEVPAAKRGRKSIPKPHRLPVEPETPEIIEFKCEPSKSPSLFANFDASQIDHGLNHVRHMPTIHGMSTIVAGTSHCQSNMPSSNMPPIYSQTISSSVQTKINPFGNFGSSQFSSTHRTDSQAVTGGDNYLDFILSGSKADPNRRMVDCGIQCAIRAQCDAQTSTSPRNDSSSEFDLLDVMFLNRMADRLNIDRETVIEASRDVIAEIERTYDLPRGEGGIGANYSESIFGSDSFVDFDRDYSSPFAREERDSIVSSAPNSIISTSPTNFDYGI